MVLIDPPAGWRYGFPKPYDNPNNLPLENWLLANGYPQHEIDNHGAKYYRFLGTQEEVDDIMDPENDPPYTLNKI